MKEPGKKVAALSRHRCPKFGGGRAEGGARVRRALSWTQTTSAGKSCQLIHEQRASRTRPFQVCVAGMHS